MTPCFPTSKPAIIFNFVSKVVAALGLVALLTDNADMSTDFIVEINKYGKIVSVLTTVLRNNGSGVGRLKRAARLHALWPYSKWQVIKQLTDKGYRRRI
jgi:hypothetical protein